jgi:hypothetical protein
MSALKLLNINENGVAWVKTDCGKCFGIVNAFEVLDEDGLPFEETLVEVLEPYTEVDQDWDNEANVINFVFENGESANLVITAFDVQLLGMND